MAVPGFQEFMLPLLRMCADGKEHSFQESFGQVADALRISVEDTRELLPSGRQTRMQNRVYWTKIYLQRAGLIEGTKRGHFRITARGQAALASKPNAIDINFLKQYPEFAAFRSRNDRQHEPDDANQEGEKLQTPEELLEESYQRMRQGLAAELLNKIRACSPQFFERLVVDLLVRMGYGGSWKDAARAIGKAADGGIDGIINEDRLGLDVLYIQAKRWEGAVGRPEIQKFVGALQGQRARKGIFLTTSSFTKEAQEYARQIESKVVLIDGEQLVNYMIDFGLGVSTKATYEIKKVDSDFFDEEA